MKTNISDLFFNHAHPNLTGWFRSLGDESQSFDHDGARSAILKDAQEFVADYGALIGFDDAEALADDFMRRL